MGATFDTRGLAQHSLERKAVGKVKCMRAEWGVVGPRALSWAVGFCTLKKPEGLWPWPLPVLQRQCMRQFKHNVALLVDLRMLKYEGLLGGGANLFSF